MDYVGSGGNKDDGGYGNIPDDLLGECDCYGEAVMIEMIAQYSRERPDVIHGNTIRCKSCGHKLFEGVPQNILIKCQKCKGFNHVRLSGSYFSLADKIGKIRDNNA